jgi:hypothetical protein
MADGVDDLSPYELERAALIARNRARLEAMGIPLAAATLAPPVAAPPPRPRPHPPPRRARPPSQPTRASRRLRGGPATRSSGSVPSPPRSPSPSPPPPKKWDPAELAAIEAERAAALAHRLTELDLAGLIDSTRPADDASDKSAEARFAVVGAPHKGQRRKHYVITLRLDSKGKKATHSCECMDYKCRRAKRGDRCKHITLVLTQLGCVEEATRWPGCVRARVMGGGGEAEGDGGSGGGRAPAKRKAKAEPGAARAVRVKAEPGG